MTRDVDPIDRTPLLSPDDERVLDALFEDGFDPQRLDTLPPADRARGEALLRLFGVLEAYPVGPADESLVDATLARIERYDENLRSRMRLVPDDGPRTWRPRWADLVAVAAMVLLGFGVLVPVAHRVRQQSAIATCASNLRAVGQGMGLYANDFAGSMPFSAGLGTGVSSAFSRPQHSDHLGSLVHNGYCEAGCLRCPGHESGGPSYAYRVPVSMEAMRLDARPEMAVLSDRNPAVDLHRQSPQLPLVGLRTSSTNHDQLGQQVLFGTLEVRWLTVPVVKRPDGGTDNLWLILVRPGVEDLPRTGRPQDPRDNFLSQ